MRAAAPAQCEGSRGRRTCSVHFCAANQARACLHKALSADPVSAETTKAAPAAQANMALALLAAGVESCSAHATDRTVRGCASCDVHARHSKAVLLQLELAVVAHCKSVCCSCTAWRVVVKGGIQLQAFIGKHPATTPSYDTNYPATTWTLFGLVRVCLRRLRNGWSRQEVGELLDRLLLVPRLAPEVRRQEVVRVLQCCERRLRTGRMLRSGFFHLDHDNSSPTLGAEKSAAVNRVSSDQQSRKQRLQSTADSVCKVLSVSPPHKHRQRQQSDEGVPTSDG